MIETYFWVLPLVSAISWALAGMASKKAVSHGVDVYRLSAVSNWLTALVFLPALLMADAPLKALVHWQPLVTAVFYTGGVVLSFLAFRYGDASIVTPLLGLKVILVVIITMVLVRTTIPFVWIIGAIMTVVGLFLLRPPIGDASGGFWKIVVLSLVSGALFSMSDVLTQQWGPAWNKSTFLSAFFMHDALLSFLFIPFFKGRFITLSRAARWWMMAGAVIMAIPAFGISWALLTSGNAVLVNIVFNSRGLWSVLLIATLGRLLKMEEQSLDRRTLLLRFSGATMMFGAIVLVLLT